MGARTIYFNREIEKKLDEVKNVSGLISELLQDYFKNLELTDEQIIQNVKDLIAKKKQEEKNRIKAEKEKAERELYYAQRKEFMSKYPMNCEFHLKAVMEKTCKDYSDFIDNLIKENEL